MKKRVERVKDAVLDIASFYKEKYEDEAIDHERQSSIYEYINMIDDHELDGEQAMA